LTTFELPPITLEIDEGDIAAETTDAIVNAANNAFWMGSGVAGAIKRRGGDRIEAEAMAQGPVEPGDCVQTTAGQLKARAVIHAAVMGQDLRTSSEIIDRATRNALSLAEASRFASISLPAFGTGVGGFSLERCARIMLAAIRDHATVATSLRRIRLILFGRPSYETVAAVAAEMLGPPAPPR
jgi:O-acetyl-ADP-ribose deacetylase (regulator of RNase III)